MGTFLSANQNLKLSLKYLDSLKIWTPTLHIKVSCIPSQTISVYTRSQLILSPEVPWFPSNPQLKWVFHKLMKKTLLYFFNLWMQARGVAVSLWLPLSSHKRRIDYPEQYRWDIVCKLNVIYERRESKSYDPSTDKVLEKDMDESSVKDRVSQYYEFTLKKRRFSPVIRSD